MADIGVRLRGNSGEFLQVDGEYANMALSHKGSFTTSAVVYTSWRSGSVTISGAKSPVIAIRCSTTWFLSSTVIDGSTYTYTIATQGAATVEYWIFDEPDYSIGSGPVGLRIRNRNTGLVVFDSRKKYMKVIDFFSTASYADVTKNYPGKIPAVVISFRGYAYKTVVVRVGNQFFYQQQADSLVSRTSNTDLFVRLMTYFSSNPSTTPIPTGYDITAIYSTVTVVDVADL
ncbi:hypothetical protein [Pseudomonas tohonis]|uniref:hypothetical protein n=1 Tax=Pseudomonas tohonis TaxID=2725477 RepID=UPI001F33C0E8|nr:hypothetical protein [Pseudomonas tohonis]